MANSRLTLPIAVFLIAISSGPWFSECTNFTIVNRCKETIWPGIIPSENISTTGLALKSGQSTVFTAPSGWHGRIWGRTGCSFDSSNKGTCLTGGCGNETCSVPGKQPATIAEFTLGELDFYDVSLVGGFNLPMIVAPVQGKGNCSTVGCEGDLRERCPSELAVKSDGKTIGCQSACDYFKTDEYCCKGTYENPESCRATNYSSSFKKVCPAAYSYAYDAPTSMFTCSNVSEYIVTFCPSRNQTECTYHGHELVCNESGLKMGIEAITRSWWIVMLTLFATAS
ncbi:unnamed protein product [Amaranthus hypochondriacus]